MYYPQQSQGMMGIFFLLFLVVVGIGLWFAKSLTDNFFGGVFSLGEEEKSEDDQQAQCNFDQFNAELNALSQLIEASGLISASGQNINKFDSLMKKAKENGEMFVKQPAARNVFFKVLEEGQTLISNYNSICTPPQKSEWLEYWLSKKNEFKSKLNNYDAITAKAAQSMQENDDEAAKKDYEEISHQIKSFQEQYGNNPKFYMTAIDELRKLKGQLEDQFDPHK